MKNRSSLLVTLFCLTALFIGVQLAFFIGHYKVTDLVDSIASSSIATGLLQPVVLRPMLLFVALQLVTYGLFVGTIWFIAVSLGELFTLSGVTTYVLGICTWCLGCDAILVLNAHFYPDSFFAHLFQLFPWLASGAVVAITVTPLLLALLLAFIHYFRSKHYRVMGSALLLLGAIMGAVGIQNSYFSTRVYQQADTSKPNIIIIGLDSLRPDFTGYFNNKIVHTPNIDAFLSASSTFTHAYTPLARTFPSWVSILTGQYPKHNHARINLANPVPIISNDNLAKALRAAGYETTRGTDESRFANITEGYGFDHVLGPKEGANDFLLGGLTDFPLTNLLVNLPIARYLFPYNYGNRAAAITYEPDSFIQLIKSGLAKRSNKPQFIAIHLCLPHWPFTWAHDGEPVQSSLFERYQDSVEAVDHQFGQLLKVLKADGLLEHSVVIILSDHGVALALPGDNLSNVPDYMGDPDKLKLMHMTKYSSSPAYSVDFNRDYGIDTSYGQGTEVLSDKQHHVLLAIRGYNVNVPVQKIDNASSLIDIAPTVLSYLHLPALAHVDGASLWPYITHHQATNKPKPRPFYTETADKVVDIETDKVVIDKLVEHTIGLYQLNPETGLLYMNPAKEKDVVNSKERSIMLGDWILARYPAQLKSVATFNNVAGKKASSATQVKVVPPFYVVLNIKTGKWTIGLDTPFAKTAPVQELMRQFKLFYGNEV